MRNLILTFSILIFSQTAVFGQETGSKNDSPQSSAPKKGLSTEIYEKDPNEDNKTINAKVNLIREMGDIEVFFDGKDKGPYILKEGPNLGLYKERLIKSQKSKDLKASVKIEKDYIVSVEVTENKEKPKSQKSDVDSVLDSVFKK